VRPVSAGVFFAEPRPLPHGRHGLAREEILRTQRERLMIAFTELLAAHGYARVTVAASVARAQVSRAAFYACFADKEDCSVACYDRFIEVLLRRVQEGLTGSENWIEWLRSALEGYLGTLQSDRVAARAFQIELEAAGAVARARRRQALGLFADLIDQRYREFSARDERLGPIPAQAHLATVYAVRQLACDLLEDPSEPDLGTIIPTTVRWIAARDLGARQVDAVLSDSQ
jgi:AcrR family transcriptional regulator